MFYFFYTSSIIILFPFTISKTFASRSSICMGLSICKGIARGLGGSVGVASTPNVETIFYLELPTSILNKELFLMLYCG